MKRIDIDITNQDIIKELLDQNPLGRNKNLKVMIQFLNNIDGQLVLNLDGGWGTGKSIFLKQLEYINQQDYEFSPTIVEKTTPNLINNFKEKYEIFYYNAWENDLYESPLESLIFQILIKFSEADERGAQVQENINRFNSFLKSAGIMASNVVLKKISGGLIELSDFKADKEDVTKTITSTEKRKQAIEELLKLVVESLNKHLLIVIDELDRCKPSYAVELLEVIKHFFNSDNIVFLFASNKAELTQTIKLIYGQEFDGYRYLNRFFDFEFTLPPIDVREYLKYKFSNEISFQYRYVDTITAVCNYFDLSMRDIDRYASLCSTLKNFWSGKKNRYYNHYFINIIMIPYAIGLKIFSVTDFKKFLSGNGARQFIEFCQKNNFTDSEFFGRRNFGKDNENNPFNFEVEAEKVYQYITKVNDSSFEGESEKHVMKDMLDILTMLSDINSF
ncbi:KAP family P-loop NTPase fold protein [Enterococcus viikkiensis]